MHDLRIEDFPIVKGHALAELHFESPWIDPVPTTGQTRRDLPILGVSHQGLVPVICDGPPVRTTLVDDANFTPWSGRLLCVWMT